MCSGLIIYNYERWNQKSNIYKVQREEDFQHGELRDRSEGKTNILKQTRKRKEYTPNTGFQGKKVIKNVI